MMLINIKIANGNFETGLGAEALSVTVKSTGFGFDPQSRK